MTKLAHFIPVKFSYLEEDYAKLYLRKIKGLATRTKLSMSFHPQTNGQAERTIQILEDMLRACVIDFKGDWHNHFHLIDFLYNNSYNSIIGMTPFESLYGSKCRSPKVGLKLVRLL
ncbi:hypothetical protein MTR67_044904 [Solanum verrucosum]|uniref:Integrase catalytic domain-containing protein n=1 Tax=Solanum verrucosum TaxID=315347 RepID=A0AAF0UTI6_SOLVR|nr:hypothetical protein MTR67_044904 [Solanum verrucosum]